MDWKTLQSKYILKNQYLSLRHDICEMPSGQIVDPYYSIEVSDWVNIVAVTDNNQVLLVRQYRHGMGKTLLGLPSGYIEENEYPLEAAKRELSEETGYATGNIIKLAEFSPNPASHNNLVHSYLALNVKKNGEQNLDLTEDIKVELHPLESVRELINKKEIVNAIYIASFFFAFDKLGK